MAYNKEYWEYQKGIGENKYHINFISSKFISKIKPSDIVLDFGCGGGYVLNSINCCKKIGIEINPSAQKKAREFNIEIFESFESIKEESIDVIISNSALEHIINPIETLSDVNRVLKKKGKLMISVPHEDLSYDYVKDDINQHFYTWSPMSIGNLIQKSGFEIEEVKTSKIIQPPFASLIFKIFGKIGYRISGKFYRMIRKVLTPFKRIGVSADIIVYATKI
jgi:SAM-dependent methyltransferase